MIGTLTSDGQSERLLPRCDAKNTLLIITENITNAAIAE